MNLVDLEFHLVLDSTLIQPVVAPENIFNSAGINYQHSLWQERTTDDCKESESFKELLTARTQEFIEEILQPHFGGMITFVKDCEMALERGNVDYLKTQESTFTRL
jgi:hypothetical protein